MRSLPSRRIVAESLAATDRTPPPTAHEAPLSRARVVAQFEPGEDDAPPAFLRVHQRRAWQRVLTALREHGAAILAEPVGSGKTWIALAASCALGRRTAVIVPAILREQWHLAVRRSGCDASVHTLEALSRGRLPPERAELVIIDEAHRLRGPRTRRVHWLAPWLPGRQVVFLTGTPIINSPRDLLRLLRLVLPDDALRLDGVPSLEQLARDPAPPHALRRLVIREATWRAPVQVVRRPLPTPEGEARRGEQVVADLAGLRLGETPAIARLVRVVLLDAAASSDAAWFAALRRYRRLLTHASDAGGLSRALLRHFTGSDLTQLVLWPVVSSGGSTCRLPLEDLATVGRILERGPADAAWLAPLGVLLEPDTPTICFTRHIATARRLVAHLGAATAWVDGSGAGIGAHRMPRAAVLAAFGPDRTSWRLRRTTPWCLVLSDVGAEGLDLQGAARVVHVDLPWHAMGLAQRLGRCARLGQQATIVEEVRRGPPPAIECALRKDLAVRRKGERSRAWLERVARGLEPVAPPTTRPDPPGALRRVVVAGLRAGPTRGVLCLAHAGSGWQQVAPERVVAWIDTGRARPLELDSEGPRPEDATWWDAIQLASAPALRTRHDVVRQLAALARRAARRRDHAELGRLDALLAASSLSHPLGIERQFDALATAAADPGLEPAREPDPRAAAPTLDWVLHLVDVEGGLD